MYIRSASGLEPLVAVLALWVVVLMLSAGSHGFQADGGWSRSSPYSIDIGKVGMFLVRIFGISFFRFHLSWVSLEGS